MPIGYHKPLTKKQEAKIRREYLNKPIKPLAEEMNITYGRIMRLLKKWGLEIPKEIRESRKRSGMYSKGHVSFNKGMKQYEFMSPEQIEKSRATRFQPGRLPHNTKYDGHERISKDGYVEIRLRLGVYKLKHLHEWEKINGKLPEGHILNCINGDKTNCCPENWRLISREENMLRNSKHQFPKEIIPSMILIGKITKTIKKSKNATQ